MEAKLKHLEFLQATIARLSGYIFVVKGWTITLIAALFALAAKETKPSFVLVAYFPAIVFWALDGYFLGEERRFRALYDEVRTREEVQIDFSMHSADATHLNEWAAALLSPTALGFYGPLLVVLFVIGLAVR